MVKRLKEEDTMSHEEYLVMMENLTDAEARELGYPSADVLKMEDRLSSLAGQWRRTKDATLIHEYHSVLYRMILNGYDVSTLPIQDQLPDDLMPELPPKNVREAIQREYATE